MSRKPKQFPARIRRWARLARRRIAHGPRWIWIAGAVAIGLVGVVAIIPAAIVLVLGER
jgi:hypothetical protein